MMSLAQTGRKQHVELFYGTQKEVFRIKAQGGGKNKTRMNLETLK